MKNTYILFLFGFLMAVIMAFTFKPIEMPYGMAKGTPEIKSITSLAFGPEGVLFIGDSKMLLSLLSIPRIINLPRKSLQ